MSDQEQEDEPKSQENVGLISQFGPVVVDWPRSLGYFGGIAVATAAGILEPPVAIFIAAVPLVQMLNRPGVPRPGRFAAQVFEGASTPVGGGTPATTIQMEKPGQTHPSRQPVRRPRILDEARELADEMRARRRGRAMRAPVATT